MREARKHRMMTLARSTVWGVRDLVARPTAGLRTVPDYLIVGAQRCGTTTLQDLISSHPQVRAPFLRKGIHYFDTGFQRGESWYRSQFPYRRHGDRITGEASPYYLYHPLVPGRVAALMPDVKIIALLRDPVDRAISHYKHEVRRGFEQLELEEAMQQEEARLAGEEDRMASDPAYFSFTHQHFSYQARGLYADQLQRYRHYFPSASILAVESEALWTDPEPVLKSVFDFLDLEPWMPPSVPHLNATAPSAAPEPVRAVLAERFADSNRRLVAGWGLGGRWS